MITMDGHIEVKPSGMSLFAELFMQLGTSTKTNDKLESLTQFFSAVDDKDKVWVIALFSGRKPKRTVNATQLAGWSLEMTGLPSWLYEESYHTVGDLAETIALLLPEAGDAVWNEIVQRGAVGGDGSLAYYLERLMEIGKEEERIKKEFILQCWARMNKDERLVFNKLITRGFRIGVSQKMIVNALAKTTKTSASVIAHRISGNWDPATISFENLLSGRGSSLSDELQAWLGRTLETLSLRNRAQPMVFFCAGTHCWLSYNAALRATALGYREVYWYRGGIEAWIDAGGEIVPARLFWSK